MAEQNKYETHPQNSLDFSKFLLGQKFSENFSITIASRISAVDIPEGMIERLNVYGDQRQTPHQHFQEQQKLKKRDKEYSAAMEYNHNHCCSSLKHRDTVNSQCVFRMDFEPSTKLTKIQRSQNFDRNHTSRQATIRRTNNMVTEL